MMVKLTTKLDQIKINTNSFRAVDISFEMATRDNLSRHVTRVCKTGNRFCMRKQSLQICLLDIVLRLYHSAEFV